MDLELVAISGRGQIFAISSREKSCARAYWNCETPGESKGDADEGEDSLNRGIGECGAKHKIRSLLNFGRGSRTPGTDKERRRFLEGNRGFLVEVRKESNLDAAVQPMKKSIFNPA